MIFFPVTVCPLFIHIIPLLFFTFLSIFITAWLLFHAKSVITNHRFLSIIMHSRHDDQNNIENASHECEINSRNKLQIVTCPLFYIGALPFSCHAITKFTFRGFHLAAHLHVKHVDIWHLFVNAKLMTPKIKLEKKWGNKKVSSFKINSHRLNILFFVHASPIFMLLMAKPPIVVTSFDIVPVGAVN